MDECVVCGVAGQRCNRGSVVGRRAGQWQAVGATLELEGSSLDEATAGPQERRRQEREGTLRMDAGETVAAAAWTTTAAVERNNEGGCGREGGGGISGRRRLCDGRDEIAWGLGW